MKRTQYDKISTYFKLNKKSFIIATITGIIFNGLMAFVPIVQGKLIDAYKEQEDVKYIIYFAIAFLAFVIFIQVNRYLKDTTLEISLIVWFYKCEQLVSKI